MAIFNTKCSLHSSVIRLGVAMTALVALAVSGCGGSSGFRTMPGGGSMMPGDGYITKPPTLTLYPTGNEARDPEAEFGFSYWGLWGGVIDPDGDTCRGVGCPPAGDAIFWAYLLGQSPLTAILEVEGVRSGTSPIGGSAVWTGGVHAAVVYTLPHRRYDVTHPRYEAGVVPLPIKGKSRLEVDFATGTVDVDFTNFDDNRADMSWSGLILENGEFGGGITDIEGSSFLDGSFYGASHEGAAGVFGRAGLGGGEGLAGVFGALRTSAQVTEAMQP